MDSLTHTVLGICLGDAIAGKKMGKRAMLYGALANNLPDIDVVSSLWMSQADGLLAHRGFTHSIFFAMAMTPLLAVFFHRRLRNENANLNDWLLLFGSGLFIHIFIDALTSYGTGWFEPFSHHRITFNILFVADVLYTLPFLAGAVMLIVLKKDHPRRRFWQRLAIGLNLLYLVFALRNKIIIDRDAKATFAGQGIAYTGYFTTPTPLNNFLWFVVASTKDGYYSGYRSILDTFDMPLYYFSKNDSLLKPYSEQDDVKKLVRFANGYYALTASNGEVILNDLRFGRVNGWTDPAAPFVFRYSLSKNADNDLVIQRGRMEAFSRQSIRRLFSRMKGDQ